jgi:hypothetical protein
VESVTLGEGALFRNEPLVLRVSHPLQDQTPPQMLAVVKTARGKRVAVAVRADGHHLILSPRPSQQDLDLGVSALWPQSPYLDVFIPSASAGKELRRRDGMPLAESFSARVPLSADLIKLPGALEIRGAVPEGLTERIVAIAMDDPDFEVQIQFNAPLDPASLEAGVQIIDRTRQDRVLGAKPLLVAGDEARVRIRPFAKGFLLWNADTLYEVLLTKSLRSRDGRALPEARSLKFRTEKEGPRLLQIGFDLPTAFDQKSLRSWNPAWPKLRPLKEEVPVYSDVSGELRTLGDLIPMDEQQGPGSVPSIFSGKPSHSQILIPGPWFQGTEPCVITGISFFGSPISPACRADLALSMGLLEESRALAGLGLSEEFESNLAFSTTRPIFLPTRSGMFEFPVTKEPGPAFGILRASPWKTFEIPFTAPFDYPGRGQDLVLDIRNISGVIHPEQPSGIDLSASIQTRRPNSLLIGELGSPRGRSGSVSLTMALRAHRYSEVVSRWYLVQGMETPQFRDAGWKGEGVRDHHFSVMWQAGEPTLDGNGEEIRDEHGRPICVPTEKDLWSVVPPTSGSRAIRAKITFHAAAIARADRPIEIEYLLLTYREAKNQ